MKYANYSVYIIEIALKLSPFPLSVQRKELSSAQALYNQICDSMAKGHPSLLELTCEQVKDKKVTVLLSEVLAVQVYEKTALGSSSKRPGFSFEA